MDKKIQRRITGICIGAICLGTVINLLRAPSKTGTSDETDSTITYEDTRGSENTVSSTDSSAVDTADSDNITNISPEDYPDKSGYMVYYGVLDADIIETMRHYEMVIIHPQNGNITREQVAAIQASGTIVLGYITIGEDLRTYNLTAEEMLQDERFVGDGTGPKVDPREDGQESLDGIDVSGKASPAGTGYASYYLDDNDYDGTPDINVNFGCAFTNIGDPNWYKVLDNMTIDGQDRVPGLREILTEDYGRGLGCDGVFLDTIDTAAPNAYTADTDAYKTRFEWTSVGVRDFCKTLKENYPDKLVLQNRGLFFYNPNYPMYEYNPREYVDYLLFESYRLDSNTNVLYYDTYFTDNKYNYLPRIIAEAQRPDGFQVVSLGYAAGPEEYELEDTLTGKSDVGLDILLEDIYEAQDVAGFSHYITNADLTLVNTFVKDHTDATDNEAPVWTSTYNINIDAWPPEAPVARVGICKAESTEPGSVTVSWDVALDKNDVTYTIYYGTENFDFDSDPDLTEASATLLVPEVGKGYTDGTGPDVYPFEETISGLESGQTYYLVIRAKDSFGNEEKNTTVISAKIN